MIPWGTVSFLFRFLHTPYVPISYEKTEDEITWSVWQKQTFSLVSNTNLHYNLISEQILVQRASWYMENRAITLLAHLLPQYGQVHGNFVKI